MKNKNPDWQKKLSPEEYFVTRQKGTEPPFSGKYVHHSENGIYYCVCCQTPLFSSDTKFDSQSGWPSFFASINPENITYHADTSHGMTRTEILCKNCDAHLGHIFEDGPQPTGQRYCVNSLALQFKKTAIS